MVKIFIGVIIAAFVVIVGFMIIDPDLSTNVAGSATELVDSENNAKYSIEGEVYKAGTFTLKDGATMGDLIEAAGGLTAVADERCFFDTVLLTSGTTYYISSRYDATDVCNASEVTKVNINNDDASKLSQINGITTSIANSIVSWRTENSQFTTLEDLLDVYGIGTATYRKIRNYVILHE